MDDQTTAGSQGAQDGGIPPPPPPPAGQQYYDPNAYTPPPAGQQDPFAQGQQAGGDDPFAGGFDPSMGAPLPGDMAAPGAPPPPPKPSIPSNFQLGALLPPVLKIKVPEHSLEMDDQYFLHLLAGSISLTKDEKIRIIESIPKLRQAQVDELVRIFEEERRKFAELGQEHVPQLDKLAKQHYEDWIDIELRQEQQSRASNDEADAEAIRKQLGLS